MIRATARISSGPNPRDVVAGVPMRIPDDVLAGSGSNGICLKMCGAVASVELAGVKLLDPRTGRRQALDGLLERAGDVIPYVVKSFPKRRTGDERRFEMPNECPRCEGRVIRPEGEVYYRCTNPHCTVKLEEGLRHPRVELGRALELAQGLLGVAGEQVDRREPVRRPLLEARVAGTTRGWSPAVDMIDKKDEIILRADLPGLDQKDINVRVENGVLMINGSRQEEREAREEDYYCCERWSGVFSRSISLPPGVDQDKIRATFKNGVLEVHVPKSPQAVGKSIEIKAA